MKEVSVRDIFLALKENGFYHLRQEWTAEDVDGVIVGGCLLQQGAMNLGVKAHGYASLQNKLNQFDFIDSNSRWSLMEENPVGDLLIHWNDATTSKWIKDKDNFEGGRWVDGYLLPTYEDVVKMAEEILNPFMDKKVYLEEKDWNFRKIESVSK